MSEKERAGDWVEIFSGVYVTLCLEAEQICMTSRAAGVADRLGSINRRFVISRDDA